MIQLTLPYPPTINHYYGNKRNGGRYILPRGIEYQKKVKLICIKSGNPCVKKGRAIGIDVIVFMPDNRRRDLDNLWKCLLDSLTKSRVWEDDSLIEDKRIRKGGVSHGGYLAVKIWEL